MGTLGLVMIDATDSNEYMDNVLCDRAFLLSWYAFTGRLYIMLSAVPGVTLVSPSSCSSFDCQIRQDKPKYTHCNDLICRESSQAYVHYTVQESVETTPAR